MIPGEEWKKNTIIIMVKNPDRSRMTNIFLILNVWSQPGSAKQNRNPKTKANTFESRLIFEYLIIISVQRRHKNSSKSIILIFSFTQYRQSLPQCSKKYPNEYPIMPVTGVIDSTVAFLLNTLFVRMPETPDTIASTKHRLKPIALNFIYTLLFYIRSQGEYA